MSRFLCVVSSLLLATLLTACGPGIGNPHQAITFDSQGLVVHARGQPDAHVSPAGALNIGGRNIAVTPAQRQLLQAYYQQAVGTVKAGEAIGKQGVEMAAHGVDAAVESIFHDGQSTAEKKLDAQSDQIEAAADALCARVKTLGTMQAEIARDIPAFAPYAASAASAHCSVSHTTVTRDDDGHVTTSTTDGSGQPAMQPPPHGSAGPAVSAAAPASGK